MQVYKAVVLVSVNEAKVWEKDRRTPAKKFIELVKSLRCQEGVRQIEGIFFKDWIPGGPTKAPWRPNGALVFVEARDKARLKKNIDNIFGVAKKVDQELMVLEPLGDVDSF